MQVDIICPPRINNALGDFEKCLIENKEIHAHLIQKNYNELCFSFGLFGSLIRKYQIYKFVKSKTGRGIKHITNEALCWLLYFMHSENFVVTCHGINIPILDYFSSKNKFFYNLYLKGMEKAERIITVSNQAKKDIIKYTNYPEDRIHVIYHGVDHANFKKYTKPRKIIKREEIEKKYDIDEHDKIILNVGSEQPRKNIPTLIKAFYELKKTIPNVKLIRVGPSDWKGVRERLIKLIRQLRLEKDVIFAGIFPNEHLPDFYNSADLFVSPSYSEGFGIPNLEAMACGCPVITTDKTSIPEVVGDAAIKLSNPFNVDLLARKMEEILTSEGLRQDTVKRGLKQAKKFTLEKYTKEVYKVYKKVLK